MTVQRISPSEQMRASQWLLAAIVGRAGTRGLTAEGVSRRLMQVLDFADKHKQPRVWYPGDSATSDEVLEALVHRKLLWRLPYKPPRYYFSDLAREQQPIKDQLLRRVFGVPDLTLLLSAGKQHSNPALIA